MGNSKNRTATQAEQAKSAVINFIQNIHYSDVYAFTDGSVLGNPGPCCAAAAVYIGSMDSEPVELCYPVSKCSSSYHGELHALLLVLQFMVNFCKGHLVNKIHIFCDCQSAIQAVCNNNNLSNFQQKIINIKVIINKLQESSISTVISWIGGHINLLPNDLADRLAKKAAAKSKDLISSPPKTYSELKNIIRRTSLQKWQHYWSNSISGSHLKQIMPNIPSKRNKSITNKMQETRKIRVISGHDKLKSHKFRLKHSSSPACDCGYPEQSEEHILLHCQLYSTQREILEDSIDSLYNQHNIPIGKRTIGLNTLLDPHSCLPAAVRDKVNLAVHNFLGSLPDIL